MKEKRYFSISILLIIAIILMNANCVKKKGGLSKFSKARNAITSAFKVNNNTFKNWKTSSLARNFNKAIGFAPIIKENNVRNLLDLVLYEADLIKIGAFKTLNKLSDGVTSEESKKELINAKLQATIELIKYYSVVYNWTKVNLTFGQGLYYAYSCQKLYKDNPGECFKRKSQLLESYIFRHKIEINRGIRYWLARTIKKAKNFLKDDETLKFLDTKIACKIKLMQENKNILLKSVMKLYMGGNKNYNCVIELKKFEKDIKEIGSYPGEYYYLLAKAYAHQGDNVMALEHLHTARKAEVVDKKTRNANKKVQEFYEKIYTRLYSIHGK